MSISLWFILVGGLLVAMALSDSVLKRLPLTTAMLYLAGGVVLGPLVFAQLVIDPRENAKLIEHVAEIVVIISLFAAGLKLRSPLSERRWHLSFALAFGSMAVTVLLIALVGWQFLGLSVGAAVLLGAILAPTDPVLASDVQVDHPTDRDRLRFSLTAEAGLNDGTAFPFVMLGLGLLGLHEIGSGWRWLALDVVWAIGAGIGVGALLGTLVGQLVLYLRREHREALGLDDFLALGLITLAYGLALGIHAYGFLSVFAAGLAVRRIERRHTGAEEPPPDVSAVSAQEEATNAATDEETAPAYMAQAVLGFTEQLERIGTVGVVLLLGTMLLPSAAATPVIWFAPLLLLVIRPLAVLPMGLIARDLSGTQRRLIAWFGIRGIGSIYYLSYAVARGVPETEAEILIAVTFWVVAVSIIVHGLSVKPLMRWYTDSGRSNATGVASARRN